MSQGISIVITMFNNHDQVNTLLNSINESSALLNTQDKSNLELIIIDDCSLDVKEVESHSSVPLQILRLKENSGSGVARNEGFKIAKYEYVLCLDSDICLRPSNLNDFFSALKKNLNFDIIQSLVSKKPLGVNITSFQKYLALSFYIDAISDAEYNNNPKLLNTMCFLANREKFLSIGGFSDEFSNSGGEEFEITKRLQGFIIVQENTILVDHYYDNYLSRMKVIFRRSANYKDTAFNNSSFPLFLKLIGISRLLASLILIIALPLVFIYSPLSIILLISALVLFLFCDKGRLLSLCIKELGIMRSLLLIPFLFSEYMVVLIGSTISMIKRIVNVK
jgi:glycosyltransferase involved in cell wall biosynthesis